MERRESRENSLGTSDDHTLLRRFFFFLINNITTKTMLMIIIGSNESKMIAHSCLYKARSLLVFVVCPLSPVVEEDDDGWSKSKRGRPIGSEILRCRKMSLL